MGGTSDTRSFDLRGPYPARPDARDLARLFSQRLRELRFLSGLSIRELAARAGLPISTVAGLLSGEHIANLLQLLALQRGFGMSTMEELLGPLPSQTYGLDARLAARPMA